MYVCCLIIDIFHCDFPRKVLERKRYLNNKRFIRSKQTHYITVINVKYACIKELREIIALFSKNALKPTDVL